MTDSAGTMLFLCGSAFVAGVMNSVAGGGTLLTFPALTGVIPAVNANATSTIALLPGSIAGSLGYRKELAASRKFILRLLAPSLIGGYLGAWLVGQYPEVFASLVPWLILTAAVLFLIQQPVVKWMRRHRPDHEPGTMSQTGLIVFQFLVAVYGGYFGAGIGILMLAALGFMGVGDIHRMNAAKTFLAATINLASAVEFIRKGLVNWNYAGLMAVSAILGGYVGARIALKLPPAVIRWTAIGIGFGLAAYYFVK